MKFDFSKLWDSKWFYRVLALVLAIALFGYVNAEQINRAQNNGNNGAAVTATTKRTLRVPLELKADTDKYFITGYPQRVTVDLEGSTSLVTMTANTLNFRVVADLTGLGVGTHTVRLKEQGLNKDLTYAIKPQTIKVTIQDRRTRKMPIQVKYNADSLAPGYSADTAQLSSETAEVTGGKGEINRVYQVVANLVMTRNTKADVDQEVLLQALDEDGNTLNVVLSPATVHVHLPVSLPSKKVAVVLKQTGTVPHGTSFTLNTDTTTATIYGTRAALKKIDTLTVPIDISKINKSTSLTVRLSTAATGIVSSAPRTIKVQVTLMTDPTAGGTGASESSSSSDSSSVSSASSSSVEK
ncbi:MULTISPECIES: YbbR-like domain-containing protein [unclassified Lacticaseibacillus]|uniref:CdaR family protein n=1 Tax=unclassified Lacticaseibacillus TaxID=2759744 RepID=UPI001942DDAA|nr:MULTISPECIES: CdaR family protein [unclassified Lacticaseibacillus]